MKDDEIIFIVPEKSNKKEKLNTEKDKKWINKIMENIKLKN